MEGLAGIHQLIGGLVVVAFIVVMVLAALQAAGRSGNATRTFSMVAAGLLVLQYVIGFILVGSGARNQVGHYIIALLILVPVALQHTVMKRFGPQTVGIATLIWALAAVFLSIIAYLTGMHGAVAS
ncbi:MAG: hypothetical protein U0031_02240 [Thermomicrobiales bacterium]